MTEVLFLFLMSVMQSVQLVVWLMKINPYASSKCSGGISAVSIIAILAPSTWAPAWGGPEGKYPFVSTIARGNEGTSL